MSDAEAADYMKRYPDVAAVKGYNNILGAKQHWKETGQKEGRTKAVYGDLDLESAKCYVNRFPDLAGKWAKYADADLLREANDHYKKWGSKNENRNGECGDRITKQ